MFSSNSLTRFRNLLAKSLTDTCTIEREATAQDQYGASSHSWEVVADGVNCRLIQGGESNSSGAQRSGEREVLEEEYKVALPWGTDVGADYRITVGDVRYLVVRVEQALTDDVMTMALVVRDNG
ncbi:MAG: DUF6093 family protein [Chloroflexota bacterium]